MVQRPLEMVLRPFSAFHRRWEVQVDLVCAWERRPGVDAFDGLHFCIFKHKG